MPAAARAIGVDEGVDDVQLRSAAELPPALLPAESWSEAPLTWLGLALDRIALRGMRLALSSLLHPSTIDAAAMRASARPYVTRALAARPRRFFRFLNREPAPVTMREHARRDRPEGSVVTREFTTQYRPFHCSDSWPVCVENDRVVVEHWQHHPETPRATVIALHGFTMGTAWIDAHVLMASRWFAQGFDVALVALPFHGPRAPSTARFSGEHFGSWDVARVNESVRRAVHDVDLVRRWIAAESGRPVGILGLSLGGYLAALMAELRDDWAFVIPLVPAVSLDALACSIAKLDGPVMEPPIPFAELRAAYAVHSPLTHALAVPRERVLIVGARGDCIVPPEHPYALWRHWGEPAIHWYSGSHIAPFNRARLMTRVAAHLDGLGL
jgi:pimeloyl-ACP methyl ester carboxylesterase